MPMARRAGVQRTQSYDSNHFGQLAEGWDWFSGAWGELHHLPDEVLEAAVADMAHCYRLHEDKVRAVELQVPQADPWFHKYAADPSRLVAAVKALPSREFNLRSLEYTTSQNRAGVERVARIFGL